MSEEFGGSAELGAMVFELILVSLSFGSGDFVQE